MNRARFVRIVAAAAVPAALAAAATAQAATDPTTITITGTWHQVDSDAKPGLNLPHDRTLLTDSKGHGWQVRLPKGAHPQSGATVRLKGRGNAKKFAAASLTTVAAAPKTAATTSTTTATASTVPTTNIQLASTSATKQRVLVVLATWSSPDSITQAQATQQFFSDDDKWFSENSYGKLGLTGDVTPWVHIAGPDGGLCWTNMMQTMQQAQAAALLLGYDSALYDRTVVYFPSAPSTSDCYGYAGWAFQPGNMVWLNGVMDRRTTTHEQGHNLGLAHAHAYGCVDSQGFNTVLSTNCSNEEYGDPADAMGASGYVGHFGAAYKNQLNWLPNRVADLTGGGSVTLAPYEGTAGVAAAKVVAGTRTYWLEHRVQVGMDSALPSGLAGGLLVRLEDGTLASGEGLLDMTPWDSRDNAQIAPNGSWTTPEGLVIRIGSDTGSGLPVTVGAAVAPSAPASVSAAVKSSTVTVTWTKPVSDGGSAVTGYVVTLSNGKTVTVASTTTSAAFSSLANGTYTAAVAAINAVGTGVAQSSGAVTVGKAPARR